MKKIVSVEIFLWRTQHLDKRVENIHKEIKVKSKVVPVTGGGSTQDCETSRLPQLLDNRFTYGGEVVSLMRWPAAL
jgi:hypothetical protein